MGKRFWSTGIEIWGIFLSLALTLTFFFYGARISTWEYNRKNDISSEKQMYK